MDNNKNNFDFQELEGRNFKDYLILLRKNLAPFLIIFIVCIAAAIIYALRLPDIYVSETAIKISKSGGSVLQSQPFGDFGDLGSDRIINNEIEILKSYDLREIIAKALLDSFAQSSSKDDFKLLYKSESEFRNDNKRLLKLGEIEGVLASKVNIEQKRGLDILVISAESPSPKEAAIIAALYAKVYRTYNLEINREQLSYIRNFLDQQRNEKKMQLNQAEDTLRTFQEKGGMIALDEQAQILIQQLSQFEAQMNAAKIELRASEEVLYKYKDELAKQDPKLANYLESVTSETYITALQNQISELQLNKDIALAKMEPGIDISQKVREFDIKIRELKNQPLRSTVAGLSGLVNSYEVRFNRLPKATLEFARFKRKRESSEKLFTLIEEKYQEALINEQSQAGNVLIIDNARIPSGPSKPNRRLLILIGVLMGFGLGFGIVLVRDYFDNTVKTPEDIEKQNVNVLAWIPKVQELNGKSAEGADFIIEKNPSSMASETIRGLRTRVQFSKVERNSLKTILVTSPAPQEGKTTIALNLAGSFAQGTRKTLLIDADLRKPRLHQVFNREK